MNRDQQLRYLEKLYGEVEDGTHTIHSVQMSMDLHGGATTEFIVNSGPTHASLGSNAYLSNYAGAPSHNHSISQYITGA